MSTDSTSDGLFIALSPLFSTARRLTGGFGGLFKTLLLLMAARGFVRFAFQASSCSSRVFMVANACRGDSFAQDWPLLHVVGSHRITAVLGLFHEAKKKSNCKGACSSRQKSTQHWETDKRIAFSCSTATCLFLATAVICCPDTVVAQVVW